ncbi:MAG: cob(I)yrinic acid a,c-diamide adenosyltransferase [Gemmatimonadota bacterium]|jgi:cob(I)alamin adenosyltransferase|nr:cob(I)yrinic acid a,c-diamide adenosyltransferase [Gemmatimonadota bacterium]
MKIYTRTGDSGETGLFGGGRVPKNAARVEAYGEIDETGSAIGLAIVALEAAAATTGIAGQLRTVQEDLFAIGSHLATPGALEGGAASRHLPPLPVHRVAEMEGWIDEADGELEPMRFFILPGGTEAAARLHLARAICRRAERRVLTLLAEEPVDSRVVIYLNRLSDLLFVLARLANQRAGLQDIPWVGRR